MDQKANNAEKWGFLAIKGTPDYFYGPRPPLDIVLENTVYTEELLTEVIEKLKRNLVVLAVTEPGKVKRLSDLEAALALYREAKMWVEAPPLASFGMGEEEQNTVASREGGEGNVSED